MLDTISNIINFVRLQLHLLINNPIGFRFSYIDEKRNKLIFNVQDGKVLAFKILNEGTNSNLLIGKDGVFICIGPCGNLPLGLDSWYFYSDYLEYKFEVADDSKDFVHKAVLFEKYLKPCVN